MTVTVEVPERVVERAAELGVPVDELVQQAIGRIAPEPLPAGFVRLGKPFATAAEAGAAIRGIASRNTLGGLKIKDLIEEGRRL
jgi:hypothetical protein